MRALYFAAAAALFTVLPLGGQGLGAERTWTTLPTGDVKDLPPIRAMVTSGKEVFAVGDQGLFYHYHSGSLSRLNSPTTARLTHVWARGVDEVYVLGLDGSVLIYDGRVLRMLGTRLPAVDRKYHPSAKALPTKIRPNSIWASSP